MASCLLILDEDHEILLQRILRPLDSLSDAIQNFQIKLLRSDSTLPPIFESDGWHYAIIRRDSLYFILVLQPSGSVSPLSLIQYLDQMYHLIRRFLGQKLNKINIKDNFHLIFELIDESIDFGIVQVTDYNIIHDFIKVQVITDEEKGEAKTNVITEEIDQDEMFINSHIVRTITSAVSWRPKGINYGKNEFFLDIIERVEFLMDLELKVVRSNLINGTIVCRSYLSGMPILSIGLNKLMQKNVNFIKRLKFHQCVDLDTLMKAESPVIKFIPPDGEFELCKYSLNRPLKDNPLIKLESVNITTKPRKKTTNQDRLLLKICITSYFKTQDSAKDLEVKIPVSSLIKKWKIDLEKPPLFKSDIGDVLFNLTDGTILWNISHLKGGHGEKFYDLNCMFEIWDDEIHEMENRILRESMDPPPLRSGLKLEKIWRDFHDNTSEGSNKDQFSFIEMSFEIPYYAISGLKVEYIKIEEPQLNYQSFPWVRYKTSNDKEYAYQVSI